MLEIVLALVPLLLLVVSLLLGRYPGLETISRLSARFAGRSGARRGKCQAPPMPPVSHAPSGGLLLAFGLARRPPPLAA